MVGEQVEIRSRRAMGEMHDMGIYAGRDFCFHGNAPPREFHHRKLPVIYPAGAGGFRVDSKMPGKSSLRLSMLRRVNAETWAAARRWLG